MNKTIPAFPEFLNEPEKVIRWERNEVLLFGSLSLLIGFSCSSILSWYSWLVGVAIGVLAAYYRRLLIRGEYGNLFRGLVYWYFPSRGFYKHLPDSSIRELC